MRVTASLRRSLRSPALLLVGLAGCPGDDAGTDPTAATTDEATSAATTEAGDTDATTDDPGPTSDTGQDAESSEGGDTTTGGGVDNPCGDVTISSGEPFSLDFGAAGSFSYEGDTQSCQMAGIHTGMWMGPDGTSLSFSGMSADPLTETQVGSIVNLIEVRWERSSGLKNGQADRFSAPSATAIVVEGGPFGAAAFMDPVKLCIYDVAEMNNINTGETATFPGPLGVACN